MRLRRIQMWIWAYLFLGSLPIAFLLVSVGAFWRGLGVGVLAMAAFARFAYLERETR